MEAWAIDLNGVSKRYPGKGGGVFALREVSLQVERSAAFGLLGPNGAGKTTLVKIMMTIIRPTAASGTVLGHPVGYKPALARVGYLPEHHRFPRYLTGRQTLEFFGALSGVDRVMRKRRSAELLNQVGMGAWADRKVSTYSKGMMQRIGLAQTLVNDPDLIVLDEPTDGVDIQGRRDVRDLLLHLKSKGKTIFLNSHLLSELELVCDRVAILVSGRIVKQGTINDLTSDRQRFEIELAVDAAQGPGILGRVFPSACGIPATGAVPAMPGRIDGIPASISGAILKLETNDVGQIQPIIDRLRAAGCLIRRVQWVRPSLEELFINTVEGVQRAPGAAGIAVGAGGVQ